ncbi:MAG TPA: carbohydrate ABC transporter permease [Gemmatimonadales bacterium]|nr:carbohydrate ABC transporter permease [Gemmatimonadales bacterium]
MRFRPGIALGLVLGTVFALGPLVWMVSASFMAPGEASSSPPPLLPDQPGLGQYRTLIDRLALGRFFFNSLVTATIATLLSLLINSMAAYAFAKLRFAGRDKVFSGLAGLLVVPSQVGMLPLFLMLRELGVTNTYLGVIIPWMASVLGIFMVRQYALSIPDDLLDAARLDGASELQIFRRIVLPVIAPILVTLAIYTFLGSWNDFLWPLIVLSDDRWYTLPVAMAGLSGEYVLDVELMMAGAVVTVLPVVLVFLALQRHYIQGIMVGSVKG